MIKAAMLEARSNLPKCKILGVSFLTSLAKEDLKDIFNIDDPELAFKRLFKIAHQAGIDGVVCSPHEIALVKNNHPELLVVTPGIRFKDEIQNQLTEDQKRIATPKEAIIAGADYLVIGRSLTKSNKFQERLVELENYLSQ
jgi:orotidine-5'-phosphate decarboxylase